MATIDDKCNKLIGKAGTAVSLISGNTQLRVDLRDFPHGDVIGRRKDEKYDITFHTVPANTQVLAYDETTASVVAADVSCWSEHHNLKLEIVNLDSGKQFITDDDPRAVYGVAANATTLTPARCTPTQALQTSVFVPVAWHDGARRFTINESAGAITKVDCDAEELSTLPTPYTDTEVYYSLASGELILGKTACDAALADIVAAEIALTDSTTSSARFPDITKKAHHTLIPVDFEFGQFLGCMAGDGWWDKRAYLGRNQSKISGMYLSDLEGDNATFITTYLSKIVCRENGTALAPTAFEFSKEKYSDRYGNSVRYTWCMPRLEPIILMLSTLLAGAGDAETAGSGNKRFPIWAVSAPDTFKWGLIAGLLSTDGSISVKSHKPVKRGDVLTPEREQLLMAITSTSLTLLQQTQDLLRTLGVQSRIGFSKETLRGNVSWILTIATPDVKRQCLQLQCMSCQRKYLTLLNTPVTDDAQYVRSRHIVYPKCVWTAVRKWVLAPKCKAEWKTTDPEKYARVQPQAAFAIKLYAAEKLGYLTESVAVELATYALQARNTYAGNLLAIEKALRDLVAKGKTETSVRRKGLYYTVTHEMLLQWMACLTLAIPAAAKADDAVLQGIYDAVSSIVRTAKIKCRISEAHAEQLCNICGAASQLQTGLWYEHTFKQWVGLMCGGFHWSKVESIEKTGQVETGYDLTVPGYETFMSADGIVLSNTINVHVPSSDAAVKETIEKLMPSKTPFSNERTDYIVPAPKQEQVLGLYTASTSPNTASYTFNTEEEAIDAIKRGKVPLSANVDVVSMRKTAATIVNPESGPIRDPKTGQWMLTKREKSKELPADEVLKGETPKDV